METHDKEKIKEKITDKAKRNTIWIVYIFMILTYIAIVGQFIIYYIAINFSSIFQNLALDASAIESLRDIVPNLHLDKFITGLGWITGSYLGIEQVYGFAKSLNMERGQLHNDPIKQQSFSKILIGWIGILILSIIAQIILGINFKIPMEEAIFWATFISAEYVFGRKAVKVASESPIGKKDNRKKEDLTNPK